MNYDLDNLKFDSPIATSAKQFSDISREIARSHQIFVESSREAAKEAAKRNATLVAGAEASIEQKGFFNSSWKSSVNRMPSYVIIMRSSKKCMMHRYRRTNPPKRN